MKKKSIAIWLILIPLLTISWLCIPVVEFDVDYSHVYLDKDGKLIASYVADDGQYRFPQVEKVDGKYKDAVLLFEDKGFFEHHGLSPTSIAAAFVQNIKAGRIVRGGSTITQQTIRLARQNPARTYVEKLIEAILAIKLDASLSKDEILQLYAGHAPFGGNIVGVDTAAWRIFGKNLGQLAWSEAALLAVLPNAPSSLHVNKSRDALLEKRNRLLSRLAVEKGWDEALLSRRLAEPLPDTLMPFRQDAPHLTQNSSYRSDGYWHETGIDLGMQRHVQELVDRHVRSLKGRVADHAAALVVDIHSGQVRAYVGNTLMGEQGQANDMIHTPRSPGSTLKPFLYEAAISRGMITPEQRLADVPTSFHGFYPRNYFKRYLGPIQAKHALTMSLNVPAVELLSEYGVSPFLERLNRLGLTSLRESASHYGLSLILGGGEVTPIELADAYLALAHAAHGSHIHHRVRLQSSVVEDLRIEHDVVFQEGSAYLMAEMLKGVKRPGTHSIIDTGYQSRAISWKTGTSQGFRDAWSVGFNADYVVVVWVGNADGRGAAGLIGSTVAAPLFFDIWNHLQGSQERGASEVDREQQLLAEDELRVVSLCSHSGQIAGPACVNTHEAILPSSGLGKAICEHCEMVWIDAHDKRVTPSCGQGHLRQVGEFIPPARWNIQEASTQSLARGWSQSCLEQRSGSVEITYPPEKHIIHLTRDLDSRDSGFVAKAVSSDDARLYWHLDEQPLGYTETPHALELSPPSGEHMIRIYSESGAVAERVFRIE